MLWIVSLDFLIENLTCKVRSVLAYSDETANLKPQYDVKLFKDTGIRFTTHIIVEILSRNVWTVDSLIPPSAQII